MLRRLIFLTLAVLIIFGFSFWRLSDGFSIAKISAPLPYDPRWEVESLSPFQIRLLLSQPFTYIGKGSQCYVFESADQQYVLKFFRLSRYRLPHFQKSLPLPPFLAEIQNKRIEEKRLKQEKHFASCLLAYQELKEECGLVYLHLNKTTYLAQNLTLYDNLKRPISIPIDNYAFLIQKRGEQVYSYLGQLLKEGKIEEIKKALLSLAVLIDKRMEKGIADSDAEIHKNAGFLYGKAFFIDVGQFSKQTEMRNREKLMRKLLLWLEAKDTKLAADARIILSSQ